MHNNIMAAGSRDRPPMLATGRYAQWRSRFLRYIDTRPNGDALRKCILKGPYTPTIVTTPAVPATEDSPLQQYQKETIKRIAKPYINQPPSESASEEDSDPEQAQKDKDMQKNLALIAKYFKKLYKPTNNNLRTSSNTRNKNVDTTLRWSSSAIVWDTVVVNQGIWYYAKECKKRTKRVKDTTIITRKDVAVCKQAREGCSTSSRAIRTGLRTRNVVEIDET
ncbi:hypothetical protein Tco_0009393 [Tanacetum coccineum]